MSQTKPSSLGPFQKWPNKRLRRAFPIDGHDTFRPSGDYDGEDPSMMTVVVPGAISEERAAALRKSAEVERWHELKLEDDEHRKLSLCFYANRAVFVEVYKAVQTVAVSGVYPSTKKAMEVYNNYGYRFISWGSHKPYGAKARARDRAAALMDALRRNPPPSS